MGILILLLVIGVGQSFTSVPMLFATPTYFAQFSDTGQLNVGDKVRIAGVDVGRVRSTAIQGDRVVIGFGLGGTQIGTASRANIRTDTILGRKDLEIQPRGSQILRANGVLPLGQTTTPYQIYDAFFDVTKASSGWDLDTVKQSLNVLSQTLDQTYPHLSATLQGVQRFSDTIGRRDEQIKQLLANSNKIAGLLGSRGEQIDRLAVNAQTLLAAVNERGQAITYLLSRVDEISTQVQGLINDNPNLNVVLKQLYGISGLLAKNRNNLADFLTSIANIVTGLNDAISSGPYFKVLLVNLVGGAIVQPFIDAAFKKRGIDPENFWRGAGLPAYQWPDPNGTRLPNGAPPPAPAPLEGTPEHPGPAVPPGSPCSYTPPADGIPSPQNPLPCAGLSVGPFGGPNYGPPDVATSAPNPNGLPEAPGMPIAGVPGETPPSVPGTAVPLPPVAPPGARTEPIGPVAGPLPPPVMPPPNLTGPPPPPGPGPQLPPAQTPPLPGNPPFLPPNSQG